MSHKRRLGEDDEVPSIAAAAITVTVSSEGSKAVPTYSGYSAEAPPQSVAQETEPVVPGSADAALFAQVLRDAIQGFRSSTDAALNAAEAKLETLIGFSTQSMLCANEVEAEAVAEFQHARYMLDQKKAEVQHALQLLMCEDEG